MSAEPRQCGRPRVAAERARAGTAKHTDGRRAGSPGAVLPAGRWRVDPRRSAIGFGLRHLMLVPVRGRFTGFEGRLEVAADGSAHGAGSVTVASLDTGDPVRDERLRSVDYFDAESHPLITFVTTGSRSAGRREVRIEGDLTISGTTQPVVMRAWRRSAGEELIELELEGELSRRAFGIESAQLLDAGISDKVELRLALELVPDAQ